jgi:lincosamide nucleotidyltransferase A/C/D/E
MMSPQDVLEVLDLLAVPGIPAWVDGGWGVDALLGEQTREHRDLDLAVRSGDESRLRAALARAGLVEVSAEPHNPVFEDGRGRTVDVHFVDMTVEREGPRGWMVYGDIAYDVGAFEGQGMIGGRRVACTTLLSQLRSHSGYALDQGDLHDVAALHRRFAAELPPGFALPTMEDA